MAVIVVLIEQTNGRDPFKTENVHQMLQFSTAVLSKPRDSEFVRDLILLERFDHEHG